MKQAALTLTFACLLTLPSFGQSAPGTATNSEKQAIMKVFDEHLKAMQAEQNSATWCASRF